VCLLTNDVRAPNLTDITGRSSHLCDTGNPLHDISMNCRGYWTNNRNQLGEGGPGGICPLHKAEGDRITIQECVVFS
jgi:hypothetical protein